MSGQSTRRATEKHLDEIRDGNAAEEAAEEINDPADDPTHESRRPRTTGRTIVRVRTDVHVVAGVYCCRWRGQRDSFLNLLKE